MKHRLTFLFTALLFAFTAEAQSGYKIDKNTFGDLKARSIGPAVMSGRIAAIDAVKNDPRIFYVGTAGGGIWKTKNGGTTFSPVFDKHIQAIGAICIDQRHPDTVWAGTGEPWVRNSTSVGNGIYVTFDGGKTWKKKGLEKTERFARIMISPDDSNIIYAAALGPLWKASPDRGLYKSTDGGETWNKILYVDENSGCSGLAIDPENPRLIYAGFWDFRRKPWFFNSGGPGSGLYRSEDGGKTWSKVEKNLPEKPWGRVYVDFSPADPNVVYLLIEAKKTSFYRSEDKGKTWKLMNNNSGDVGERPFYFGFFVPDPVDTNTVYKPGFSLQVSNDGGHKFMTPFVKGGNFHSDVHALWISPKDNNLIYLGTDGGVYISRDKAKTWEFCRNIPVSQFYHVSVDNDKPYHLFGGLQDNGSWMAPSKAPGGISNTNWNNIGWGDGFNVLRDPKDSNIMYWQWQGGNVRRMYLDTREAKDIKPYSVDGTKLRFNWNTPLIIGAKSKDLYTGSQFLYRSSDMGDSWQKISPDLTTNDPSKLQQEQTGGLTIDNSEAENHCTIFTVNESPLDDQIIWAGTDDGNLQLTRDGGKTWENVVHNIEGVPPTTWVSYIQPSRFDTGTAYVTFDGHRYGDRTPYVFKTTDFGKTWKNLTDDHLDSYCHIIKEDPKNKNLLYLGTESGLFISIDGGKQWTRFGGGLPKVSVRDMAFQYRENDLVLATHGRGIYIIDDLTPLQNLTAEKLNKKMAWLGSRPYQLGFMGGIQTFNGDDDFTGSNPSPAANINYYLKKRHIFGDMFVEVYDKDGKRIKKLPAGKRKGINRVQWRMVMERPKVPSSVQLLGQALQGPSYPPGEYTVKIIENKDTLTGSITVRYDDNPHHTPADRDLRHKYIMKAYHMLEDLAFLDNQIVETKQQAATAAAETKGVLYKKLSELIKRLDVLHGKIVPVREGRITGEKRLREKIGNIYGGLMSYQGKPTQSQITGLEELEKEMMQYQKQMNRIINSEFPYFNGKLEKAGLQSFKLTDKETFLKKKQ